MCDGSCPCQGKNFVRFSGSGEWAALYVDGRLKEVGDRYRSDDLIADYLGVEEVDSDDFMLGGNDYDDVAKSLDEIKAYQAKIAKAAEDADQAAIHERLAAIKAEEAELEARLNA